MDCGCHKDDGPRLFDAQLMALLKNGPMLDEAVKPLPQALQAKLLIVQQQAGNAYAGQGEAPGVQQAQEALGQAYLALDEKKTQVRDVMDAMGLTPSARRKSWVEQAVENVKGWFR